MSSRLFALIATILLAAPAAAQSGNSSPAEPSGPRITFFGDMRARYEGFFREDLEARQRGRYRLRFGLRATITEGLDATLRLASGEASDVTSTNQTLTDFWNRKPINIDQAWLSYTAPRAAALTVGAGKFAYPVTRTQMVWDDDVNWEGAYEQVSFDVGAAGLRVVAVQAPLNEVESGRDAFMFGHYAEAGVEYGPHEVQLSVASYTFRNPDQLAVALDEGTDIDTAQSNALRHDAAGRVVGYTSGFNLIDTIAEITFHTGRQHYPLTTVANVVFNTRATDDADLGMWFSGTYGRAETANSYSVEYTFARIERDAVVSAYNFSDMGPATDVVMNMASFSYMPMDRVNLDLTAIFTRRLQTLAPVPNPTLKRIQIDARVTF